MISIIITSFKEPKTIGRAIESFLVQKLKDYEIIVIAPDKETLDIAKWYGLNNPVKIIKDPGKGKPAALNLAFQKAKGDILILTDGDVYASKNSIQELLMPFKGEKTGAVTARVVPLNKKDNMFGYWAHLFTETFHQMRKKQASPLCSGYLYAIRAGIIPRIPENVLADDSYISLKIIEKGYKTAYAEKAEVYVLYPSSLSDWIKQKKRTASRFYQLASYFKVSKARSLASEILFASKTIFKQIKRPAHIPWIGFLAIMRLYIWFRVFFDFRLWRRSFAKTWQRVESTK